MSRSAIIFARADAADSDNMEVANVCVRIINAYTRVAAALGMRSGKNALRKDFRQAARRHWYRTLKTLRELPPRDQRTTRRRSQLIDAWERLGVALKLEEINEKTDYEREVKKAAQLCAWVQCEYHEKKPPQPTRACVGCGETRYCSRACQQKCVLSLC
ncbi:hypothetical protein PENSPDRAFT_487195 [Peniophora sp. CONT]|nr:hypothetical protein PENSPDRAFT_487195 [Peniophora sp. CONT]